MAGALAGKRVLVVEDEYFIASDLSQALRKVDAIVVGPVATLAAGLKLAGDAADAAVLDVNLEGGFSYPIADRLDEQAIPYMFLTGYDGWSLPESYRDAPRLAKPFAQHAVIDLLSQLVESREAV